jgi:hypothetical protein
LGSSIVKKISSVMTFLVNEASVGLPELPVKKPIEGLQKRY